MDETAQAQMSDLEAAQLRERLARADSLLNALLESATEGIVALDAGRLVTLVNPAAAQMLGHSAEELIGRRLQDIAEDVDPEHGVQQAVHPILTALERGTIERLGHESVRHKDGTRFSVQYTATPLQGEAGIEGVLVTFSDTSAQRQAESQLIEYAERLVSLRLTQAPVEREPGEHLAGLIPRTPEEIIERATSLAREQLGMQIAFVSELVDGNEVVRTLAGNASSFGLAPGSTMAYEATYCRGVLSGELPNIIPDAMNDARVCDLPVTRRLRVGAYIGVPLALPDGHVYGMLCCLSHDAAPALDDRDLRFLQTFAGIVADQLAREELEARTHRLQSTAATTQALTAALEARDHYTGSHSASVVRLARAVANELELAPDEILLAEQVALLHDLGKVGVPDAVLQKPGPLDDVEWRIMREHPAIGERIIATIPGLRHLAPAVRAEHERWDGRGYPDGLAAEEIPRVSRIALCCDAYDAMTSDRPYRTALSHAEALAELRANASGQFDSAVVAALETVLAARDGA